MISRRRVFLKGKIPLLQECESGTGSSETAWRAGACNSSTGTMPGPREFRAIRVWHAGTVVLRWKEVWKRRDTGVHLRRKAVSRHGMMDLSKEEIIVADCPNCRNTVDADDLFCRKCGSPLTSEEPEKRFKALLPRTDEELDQCRGYFGPFFMTTIVFCAVLAVIAVAGMAIRRYFFGQ